MSRCMLGHTEANRSFLVVETQKDRACGFAIAFLGICLNPSIEDSFRALWMAWTGTPTDKSFKSWDHLVALIYAQLSGNSSLRGVVAGFNANPQHHYHLG